MKTYRHINSMVFIVWLCFATCLSWAGDNYHAFTDVNGRSIKGQLMGFEAGSQVVTIKREDKTYRVKLAVFSKVDQQYILYQSLKRDYTDSVKISAKRRQLDHTGTGLGKRHRVKNVKSITYEIILKNHSISLFERIDIEYCIFYRQGERNRHIMVFSHGVQYGSGNVELMKPNSKHVLKTATVLICNEEGTDTLFGSSAGAKGEIQGIWVRTTVTLPHGNRIIREFCSPNNISKSEDWSNATILAGLNTAGEKVAASL